MQKVFTTALLLFFTSAVFSQIKKGSVLLGGNVTYSQTETENTNRTTSDLKVIQISPSFGKAFKENMVFGVDFIYGGSEMESTSGNQMEEIEELGIGLFLRKYQPISKAFYLFGQGRIGYTNSEREYGSIINPASRTQVDGSKANLTFAPGISYKAGKKLFLEFALNNLLKVEFETVDTTIPSSPPITTRKNFFTVTSSTGGIPLNVGMRFVF